MVNSSRSMVNSVNSSTLKPRRCRFQDPNVSCEDFLGAQPLASAVLHGDGKESLEMVRLLCLELNEGWVDGCCNMNGGP